MFWSTNIFCRMFLLFSPSSDSPSSLLVWTLAKPDPQLSSHFSLPRLCSHCGIWLFWITSTEKKSAWIHNLRDSFKSSRSSFSVYKSASILLFGQFQQHLILWTEFQSTATDLQSWIEQNVEKFQLHFLPSFLFDLIVFFRFSPGWFISHASMMWSVVC